MNTPWGIYVHVPWCRIQCPYCAFHVVAGDATPPSARYIERILWEADQRKESFPGAAQTLFFGGGTPSRLPPETLSRIIDGLPLAPDAEISMEANPEDLDSEMLAALLDAGFTRISVGIQTLSDVRARRLGRLHTLKTAEDTLSLLSNSRVASWSADLMFGLPDSTTEDLRDDLSRLLAYSPPHVSVYGLTIEENTPFARAVARGRMAPLPDEDWRKQYDVLVSTLHDAGIERYEVSNFARRGEECLHNEGYWADRPYMGLGPSAHGFCPDGRRYRNVADTARYLSPCDPTEHMELPTRAQAAMDYVASAIRCRDGIATAHLQMAHGFEVAAPILHGLTRSGVLMSKQGCLRLTKDGFPIADMVASRLVEGLHDLTG